MNGATQNGDIVRDVLQFDDVSLHFDDVTALDHVSFELRAGETLVIVGAAASGKTMLLKSAVGLERPDSGRILLFGHDILKLRERQLIELRSRVGILFQEGGLFDSLTIEENVAYPLLNSGVANSGAGNNGAASNRGDTNGESPSQSGAIPITIQEAEARVLKALRFVELEETLDKFPNELSGGMRRRVGIARAVVTEPALVLYDSPTAGLDPITANTIMRLIIQERDLRNTATIIVTHRYQDGHMMANFRYNPSSGVVEPDGPSSAISAGDHSQMTTRFLVMREGKLVFEGTEGQLKASHDPYVQKFAKAGSS
jgi:phospholipid/cholesterol/gamma-HCH transport system ATP-binding protein